MLNVPLTGSAEDIKVALTEVIVGDYTGKVNIRGTAKASDINSIKTLTKGLIDALNTTQFDGSAADFLTAYNNLDTKAAAAVVKIDASKTTAKQINDIHGLGALTIDGSSIPTILVRPLILKLLTLNLSSVKLLLRMRSS